MSRKEWQFQPYIRIPILLLIYLGIWQLLSILVGSSLLLPSPLETGRSLVHILSDVRCLADIGNTFLRLFVGYWIGAIVGILLAILTAKSRILYFLLSPFRLLIKSTPILSFVLILLVSLVSNLVPVVVSAIMVAPMLWATTEQAILSLDPNLAEMGKVYYTPYRRFVLISLPQMLPQITASAVTALGFAWKSVITAEVISLPKFAIGNRMYLSKLYLETSEMFAWTLLVILLSLCMEAGFKLLTQRKEAAHD